MLKIKLKLNLKKKQENCYVLLPWLVCLPLMIWISYNVMHNFFESNVALPLAMSKYCNIFVPSCLDTQINIDISIVPTQLPASLCGIL